jgi:hypothetical protein
LLGHRLASVESLLIPALGVVFALSLALGGPPRFLPPWTALFLLSLALLWRAKRRGGDDALLFWGCMTLYLASFRWHGGDDIPNGMLPYAILKHGSLSFDGLKDWALRPGMQDLVIQARGRLVSFYPVAPGVLAVPLYLLPVAAGAAPTDQFLHNLSKIAGALITAGSVVLLRRALLTRCSANWAFLCALVYGLGTFAYSVSSQALYSHGPVQLGLALALLAFVSEGAGWSAAAGFGLGLAVASREDSIFFAAAGALYVLLHRRDRLLPFAAGALVPAVFLCAYWLRFSGALRPPYADTQNGLFAPFSLHAALGMLLSPTRGLFLFFPAGLFGVWGAAKACRDKNARWAPYMAAAGAALWAFTSCRWSWTGGTSFGTRYLAPTALLLAFFCGELEGELAASASRRRAWAAAAAFSILVHAAGANFVWPGANWSIQQQLATVWDASLHPLAWLFVKGGPIGAPLPWRALLALAFLGLGVPVALWLELRARDGRRASRP